MDLEAKKKALRLMTYGLYVVTAAFGEGQGKEYAAGAVNWLSQSSFDPPRIMVGIKVDSRLHSLIEKSGALGVNILSAAQKEMASAFFRSTQVQDDRLNGYRFETGKETGAPILVDAPAWLEARVSGSIRGGDHTVFVATLVNAGVREADVKPLIMWDTGWFYGG